MAPIVSTPQQQQQQTMALATVAPPPGRGTIPLSTLIDYIIQRTYHEISILAELLPKKSDMERKIDIVQFASRTRQLFIRLLALVKWANSAGKVDKCEAICTFLDRQSLYFVDSADMFAKMARETLVHGRLPNFSLPCAIDVLTTGSYPRLPSCIRDRIVPPDLITPAEKEHTLTRLSQIIQHRLVTHPLPAQLHNLKIENGRVKFHVQHEFTATLTLMGDVTTLPWRLLDIDILVEDPELGDGKALVHSLQVHYIHQLVQARLLENDKPLHDLYNCLHSFCQSLQLEVLFSQAERLLRDRYGDHVRIDEYLPGKSLILSYWRESGKDVMKSKQFTVQVHCDRVDANKPLQVTHVPALSDVDAARAGQAIKSDHLSVEKLLAQTIQVRSEGKLKSVEAEMAVLIHGACEMRDVPSVLYVPVLQPIVPTEMLRMSVDILRGTYLVSIAQYPECPVSVEIEKFLNERRGNRLEQLISELRVWLALRRCEKSVQYLPASVSYTLPICNLSGHPLEKLESTRLYLRIGGQSTYYLVVEAKKDTEKEVRFDYYMISLTQVQEEGSIQPILVKAGLLVKLDQFTITHGQGSRIINENDSPERVNNSRKRRLFAGKSGNSGNKQMKFTSQFMPELTHIYAMCEERVPYVLLTGELQRKGFSHQGIRVDGNGACMALTLIKIPELLAVKELTRTSLSKNLLSCTFRLQRKPVRLWLVELVFNSMVIESQNRRECGPLYRAHLQYELPQPEQADKVVKDFLDDWTAIALLYELVLDFYQELRHNDVNCDVISYSFKRLSLSYGPDRRHTVSINWKNGMYQLVFAMVGSTDSANCHAPMVVQLTQEFNKHKSIATLIRTLDSSVIPLTALQKLTSIPTPGLMLSDSKMKTSHPLCNFTLVCVTSWHVRLVYRSAYCLDVQCKDNGNVCVRDGAYSLYDSTKVMAGFSPVPSLKAFLEMYTGGDQQQQHHQMLAMMYMRRRSTNDDDNPPSPVGMEAPSITETFMPHQHIGSPAGRRLPPPASPMTPSSNPHTPASPAARMQQFVNSPAAAFQQLASPPSIPGQQIAPSPSGILGTPSPGVLQGINSPGTVNLHVASPGFVPTPSPAGMSHLPSPANFLNPGSQEPPSPFSHARLSSSIGSPASVPHPSPRQYSIMSPGTPQNPLLKEEFAKPASVSSQYPSRMLPQRAWAASVPTHLSHHSLLKIVTPPTVPSALSPLEQFLGSVYMRRQLQKNIQCEDGLLAVQAQTEPGVIHYKTETLRIRCSLNPNTLQSLQLQAQPTPEYQDQWSVEDLKVLEEYFEHKVACYPYKPGAVTAFNHILVCPVRVLRDFINLMRLELAPDRNLSWTMDLCLTFSPASPLGAPTGSPAIVIRANRILFMLQLTRVATPGGEPGNQILLFPFLYDTNTGQVQVAESKNTSPPQLQIGMGVNQVLKRFHDFNMAKAQQGESLLFGTIRELLATPIVPQ